MYIIDVNSKLRVSANAMIKHSTQSYIFCTSIFILGSGFYNQQTYCYIEKTFFILTLQPNLGQGLVYWTAILTKTSRISQKAKETTARPLLSQNSTEKCKHPTPE
jgi:hypothetical protein